MDASGKGVNTTRILRQLGQAATHLTHIGGQGTEEFLSLCNADGLALRTVAGGTGLRTCTTIIDQRGASTTELVEPAPAVAPTCEPALLEAFHQILPTFKTLIFSGSTAPGYAPGLAAELIAAARRAGLFVLADIRGPMLTKLLQKEQTELPHILKINLQELAATFSSANSPPPSEHSTDPALLQQARQTMFKLRADGIRPIITRGKLPTLNIAEDNSFCETPVIPVQALNTIGCGDAFNAGLLAGLAEEANLQKAILRAQKIAARNAGLLKPGTIMEE